MRNFFRKGSSLLMGLLVLGAVVGMLGLSIYFTTSRTASNLGVRASAAVSVEGYISSSDSKKCSVTFYLGCYKLLRTDDGIDYDLVDAENRVDFSYYMRRKVRVVGKVAELTTRNVLMVSSVQIVN